MAKYNLSNKQVDNLLAIISASNIKGKDAPVIMDLINSLQNPIKDERKETTKKNNNKSD